MLNGVIGREIASAPDFKYSEAFLAKKEEGFTWTEENLTAYLADPKGFIPGNKMTFAGLQEARGDRQRDRLPRDLPSSAARAAGARTPARRLSRARARLDFR